MEMNNDQRTGCINGREGGGNIHEVSQKSVRFLIWTLLSTSQTWLYQGRMYWKQFRPATHWVFWSRESCGWCWYISYFWGLNWLIDSLIHYAELWAPYAAIAYLNPASQLSGGSNPIKKRTGFWAARVPKNIISQVQNRKLSTSITINISRK